MMNEDKQKLMKLKEAIDNLDGVMIPWNIINNYISPLSKWLDENFTSLDGEEKEE